jgi:hypothetical protein
LRQVRGTAVLAASSPADEDMQVCARSNTQDSGGVGGSTLREGRPTLCQ